MHRQVWTKVNAPVDAGVHQIVKLLSEIPWLRTIESCQGEVGKTPGFVAFDCGDWQKASRFLFDELWPILEPHSDAVWLSLEGFGKGVIAP
jgi:hypothetical protein